MNGNRARNRAWNRIMKTSRRDEFLQSLVMVEEHFTFQTGYLGIIGQERLYFMDAGSVMMWQPLQFFQDLVAQCSD